MNSCRPHLSIFIDDRHSSWDNLNHIYQSVLLAISSEQIPFGQENNDKNEYQDSERWPDLQRVSWIKGQPLTSHTPQGNVPSQTCLQKCVCHYPAGMSDGKAAVGISQGESRDWSLLWGPVVAGRSHSLHTQMNPSSQYIYWEQDAPRKLNGLASSTWWQATAGHPGSSVGYYFSW